MSAKEKRLVATALAGVAMAMAMVPAGGGAFASSHREAPFITKNPKVDAIDFYMFRSYETGRDGYVTLVANYLPLQDAYGGPNYFTLDDKALYEIHLDNNGDAKEDLTFQFRFKTELAGGDGLTVPVGDKKTAVPLFNIGPITAADTSALNVLESYSVKLMRGNRRNGKDMDIKNADGGATVFKKPADYIGTKTFKDYDAYAKAHIYNINIPGCDLPGKMFVGQRAESFAVNLGTIFDLVNAPPQVVVGGTDRAGRNLVPSTIKDKNITSIELEVPIKCVAGDSGIIGGWTTASVRQARVINPRAHWRVPALEGGAWTQVSRLSTPLVNEVVIGLPDKDRFNSSEPKDDGQFAAYVTNPSLPALLEVLFGAAGVRAPTKIPRQDLVVAFLTGVTGVNANGSTAEMLRLNTKVAATGIDKQNSLGAAGCFSFGTPNLMADTCDPAGFPNGRRPGDDVVDIALRVMMGYLLPMADAPSGQLAFTDATLQEAAMFDAAFPYLRTPNPGAK
jgi:uncharacterized protein DUF4331